MTDEDKIVYHYRCAACGELFTMELMGLGRSAIDVLADVLAGNHQHHQKIAHTCADGAAGVGWLEKVTGGQNA